MDKGKVIAKEIAVEALVQEAKTCRDGALSARNKLRWYETIIGDLQNQIGAKEARKVKRKLKMLSSKCSLVRKLAGGVETEYLTWKDALKNVFSASGISNIVTRNKELRKDVSNATGSAVGTITHIGTKGAIKGAEDAKASRASHSVNQTPQKTPQEELESITKSQEATI